MSINYYFRTITESFGFAWADVDETVRYGRVLESYLDSVKMVRTQENIIRFASMEIFRICATGNAAPAAYAAKTILTLPLVEVPHIGCEINDRYADNLLGFNGGGWENNGWTNPDTDYGGFKNDIATWINTAIATYPTTFGAHTNRVVVYILKWSYVDEGPMYFPFYFKGDDGDTYYETLITK